MEGCSKYCSYCVVPVHPRRGGLAAVRRRAGRDRRPRRPGRARGDAARPERQRLPRRDGRARPRSPTSRPLLEYVAEIPGIERIRYTTSHPKEFTQRLIDVYGRVAKLVDHVHLPVQHGSDRILAAMKRGYTALEYKSTVRKLRAVRPGICDLERLHRRLSRARPTPTSSGRWSWSTTSASTTASASSSARGPGTPAAALADDTPAEVKLGAPAAPAGARSRRRATRSAAARVGTVQRVLVEGRVAQGRRRADGPHRVQPRRQLRRRRRAWSASWST